MKIGKSYDTVGLAAGRTPTPTWPAAITALGTDNIDGVYSANDGMAGGVITALKAAGVRPLPPVTGQDAELDGRAAHRQRRRST